MPALTLSYAENAQRTMQRLCHAEDSHNCMQGVYNADKMPVSNVTQENADDEGKDKGIREKIRIGKWVTSWIRPDNGNFCEIKITAV